MGWGGDEGNPLGGETSLKVNTSSGSAARPGLSPPVFANPTPTPLQPEGRECPPVHEPLWPPLPSVGVRPRWGHSTQRQAALLGTHETLI